MWKRTDVIFLVAVGFSVYCLLNVLHRDNKEKRKRVQSSRQYVNWEKVFAFVPHGLKSCKELKFSREDQLDEESNPEYAAQEEIFKSEARATFQTVENREGFSAKFREEALVMSRLVKQPFVKTVCETGFNAGHGAFLWLQSNPNVTVYSFDIDERPYVRPMARFLQKMFPRRLTVIFGDSRTTLPRFRRANPNVSCDLILIDGGHIQDVASKDFENFKAMATSHSVVIYDNYPQSTMNAELGRVWESAKQRGELTEIMRCDYEPGRRQGFSVGRFNIR